MNKIYIKPKADVVPLKVNSDIAAGIYGGGSGETDDNFAKPYDMFEEDEENIPNPWSDELWDEEIWDEELKY